MNGVKVSQNGQERVQGDTRSSLKHGHAVVIGAGIAGLTAARVLSDYFEYVTIIDRDDFGKTGRFRKGTPQAQHAHTLLPAGQAILEKFFPGIVAELLDLGAVAVDAARETAYFQDGMWRVPGGRPGDISVSASRPLLEGALLQRITRLENVVLLQGYEVSELLTDLMREHVAGVRVRSRSGWLRREYNLAADLVLDASGRNSQARAWLERYAYTPPEESTVNPLAGYVSRLYCCPEGFDAKWKRLVISPSAGSSPRGGMLVPLEGGRWHVTLVGVGGETPPLDDAGFLEFTRSLPTDWLYQAIRAAQPITQPVGFRDAANLWRHYERLPRYLEGFLVTGDAVFQTNPVHGLGMTVAVLGARVLNHVLQAHRSPASGIVAGVAKTFQQHLADVAAPLWDLVVAEDRKWEHAEIKIAAKANETQAAQPQLALGMA